MDIPTYTYLGFRLEESRVYSPTCTVGFFKPSVYINYELLVVWWQLGFFPTIAVNSLMLFIHAVPTSLSRISNK